jgi:hypothetical protein
MGETAAFSRWLDALAHESAVFGVLPKMATRFSACAATE